MQTNGKHEVIAQIARQSLVLAALLAMVLSAASIGRAQSSATSPATPDSRPAAAASAKAPALPRAKGQHEGITVHGHWVIEVKNQDGKVVTQREFENSLSSGFANPFASGSLPGGSALLSALITGQTMVTPAAWGILLEGPNYPSSQNAPCANGVNEEGFCIVLQNVQSSLINLCTPLPAGFSCNLAVNPIGTAPSFTGFQLSGSVAASQTGTISAVATMDINACGLGGTGNALPNCAFTSTSGFVAFTSANLDGNTVPGDPLPVPVGAGQTVQVTVTISFQ